MPNIDPRDPPPVPCLDRGLHAPLAPATTARVETQACGTNPRLDGTPEGASGLPAGESPPARHVYSPTGDLPGLAARIDEAQRQARERRIQQGLPAEADDGAYVLKRPRKHAAKRSKKHGQFLGTVCDSWEDKTRPR
jgi:hypothetical protein